MADDRIPSPTQTPTGDVENNGQSPAKSEKVTTGAPAPAAPAPVPHRSFWQRIWRSTPSVQKPTTPPQPLDNTREIVETVVFVVVLVLLLKSFAAEAFVIPTGSMAETLWGYQKVVNCPTCKHQFPVNASQEADSQDRKTLVPVLGCTCPNCLQPISFGGSTKFKAEHPNAVDIPDPGWTSGDRVLVAKFLYEMFGTLPNRLDVVVFKFPGDSSGSITSGDGPWPQSGPQKNHVPINYIKRLIGLPGEMIAIKGGKIYVLSPDKVSALSTQLDDLAGLTGEEREEARLQLWRHRHMHTNDTEAINAFGQGKFSIVKKPPEVLLSMRRIVYDNDHQPTDQTRSKERWPATAEWSAAGDKGFDHKAEDNNLHWLRYRHVLRGDSDQRQLIADGMGYNSAFPSQGRAGRAAGENWVGDLMLEAEVIVEKAEGELTLELSRSSDRFRAVWDLSNGRCTLIRVVDGKETQLDSTETKVKKGTYRLRFANIDRRLTVWVDNRVVEWSGGKPGVDYELSNKDLPAFKDLPDVNDLEPASIGAKSASVRVQGIKLWRDTYYTNDTQSSADVNVTPSEWSKPEEWSTKTMPLKTLYVQPGHFLCMGDNSPQSSDGRTWGLVPERLLLGRAQLVYYPFYFPWWPLSSQVNRTGMIR